MHRACAGPDMVRSYSDVPEDFQPRRLSSQGSGRSGNDKVNLVRHGIVNGVGPSVLAGMVPAKMRFKFEPAEPFWYRCS